MNKCDINIELYRGKIYCDILKQFTKLCITKLNNNIFSKKKNYQKTLTNLLSSWFFNLYVVSSLKNDSFFPDDFNDVTILKNTLLDFCKYDLTIENSLFIVEQIISDFLNFINQQIILLNQYKESEKYHKVKNKFTISKELISQIRDSNNISFYKYYIKIPYTIKDNRLNNILNNIIIPFDVYNKMKNNYSGPNTLLDTYLWIIIYRYQLLGSNNFQLAILPKIVKSMETDYNLKFECFASAINTSQKYFCSIFYDVEQYFGSLGNFFNLSISEGTYSCNPPYEKEIIYKSINKIFDHLENTNSKLTFIITLPVWDTEGQSLISNEKPKIDYGSFDIIDKIKESKYYINSRIISKEDFTYIDHNFKLYKNKTIQHTYIIVLSSVSVDFTPILNYDFYNIS